MESTALNENGTHEIIEYCTLNNIFTDKLLINIIAVVHFPISPINLYPGGDRVNVRLIWYRLYGNIWYRLYGNIWYRLYGNTSR